MQVDAQVEAKLEISPLCFDDWSLKRLATFPIFLPARQRNQGRPTGMGRGVCKGMYMDIGFTSRLVSNYGIAWYKYGVSMVYV